MKLKIKWNLIVTFMIISLFLLTIITSTNLVNSQEGGFDDYYDNEEIDSEFEDLINKFIHSDDSHSHPLSVGSKDIVFVREKSETSRYIDMYVKKREQISSILVIYVVEEKRDGKKMKIDYGLRALEYNDVNGNEIRILNGVELGKEQELYFLVDSTTETHPTLGSAFKIRIPTYVQYGYTKQNFGLVRIEEDTSLKIRTFELPYADYSGEYHDNHITIKSIITEKGEIERPVATGRPQLYLDNSVDYGSEKLSADGKYIVVYVRYEDDGKFFNKFLYKDLPAPDDAEYKTISFKIDDVPEDNNAVLLSSIFQEDRKYVKAKLFFKRIERQRMVEISAVDDDGYTVEEPIKVVVPRIDENVDDDYSIDEIPGTHYGESE